MDEMTPRRRAVLGLVIRSYIEHASPIGSKAFVEGFGLDVSPATIRSEMARLEELGYLTHRHTSAGRLPTERGYRFFVEHLLGETELPWTEKRMIRHQFHQARLELEQWARLAAAVLAHTTRTAAVATPPRTHRCHLKHLELISVRDTLVLLVLVLQGGTLRQQMLYLDESQEQEALSRCAAQLNDLFAGLSVDQIEAQKELTPLLQEIAGVVAQLMHAEDQQEREAMFREGLSHILSEPEFAEGENARQMVHTLEGRSLLDVITSAAEPLEVGGVQVLIGGDGRWEEFNTLSLVLSRYGVKGGATGVLGVVGPLRMAYGRTIGAVRYVNEVMSDLVSDWYGGEPLPPENEPSLPS
jgi:heat-inducible transcriptional repressor